MNVLSSVVAGCLGGRDRAGTTILLPSNLLRDGLWHLRRSRFGRFFEALEDAAAFLDARAREAANVCDELLASGHSVIMKKYRQYML